MKGSALRALEVLIAAYAVEIFHFNFSSLLICWVLIRLKRKSCTGSYVKLEMRVRSGYRFICLPGTKRNDFYIFVFIYNFVSNILSYFVISHFKYHIYSVS